MSTALKSNLNRSNDHCSKILDNFNIFVAAAAQLITNLTNGINDLLGTNDRDAEHKNEFCCSKKENGDFGDLPKKTAQNKSERKIATEFVENLVAKSVEEVRKKSLTFQENKKLTDGPAVTPASQKGPGILTANQLGKVQKLIETIEQSKNDLNKLIILMKKLEEESTEEKCPDFQNRKHHLQRPNDQLQKDRKKNNSYALYQEIMKGQQKTSKTKSWKKEELHNKFGAVSVLSAVSFQEETN